MNLTLKYLALGLLTYVPGLHARLRRGTGGTNSATYCYSVWLRHLVTLANAGRQTDPAVVAEFGPGDSLGIGLAAVLSGANEYIALDAVPHAYNAANLAVFDDLCALFAARAPIPGPDTVPGVKPELSDYGFPHDVLTADRLAVSLAPDRIARIRADLGAGGRTIIRYFAPWDLLDPETLPPIDLILSQAVMEHVDPLAKAYQTMAAMLATGGTLSHQIDFRSHGMSRVWNGHLAYSDSVWRIMRGRLPYLLNRTMLSDHRRLLAAAGLEIVALQPFTASGGLAREALAPRFRHATDEDIATSGAHIVVAHATQS